MGASKPAALTIKGKRGCLKSVAPGTPTPNRNNPVYLRNLLRKCLDFWALPYTDMPDPDFFDEVVRASGWKGP